jgi:hypothetical protein
MNVSNDPLANMWGFNGDADRVEMKPSWPRRVEVVIVSARGSWSRIVRDVVPSANREREERLIMERRGAEKGVEEIGVEEDVRRS